MRLDLGGACLTQCWHTKDQVGRLLANHQRGRTSIGSDQLGRLPRVGHTQAGNAMNPQLRVTQGSRTTHRDVKHN